ncbi:MAG: hypothetical protein K0R72_295 [Clostridia bacterium]|jgi:hypothetical protein|nr:hypothetical protein [Clostridia bacterium]
MGKRKLTNRQIINIATSYANDCDAVTVASLSSIYNVSSTTISNALHYAISNCLVNESVAKLIAEKAIRHDNTRRELFGYAKNNKVADLYDDLIRSHRQEKRETTNITIHETKYNSISNITILEAKYIELKNNLESYDDTFSSFDDYPYTKDELEEQIEFIEKQIKETKGQ